MIKKILISIYLVFVAIGGVVAQPTSEQIRTLMPTVLPIADAARAKNINHPTLSSYHISQIVDDALKKMSLVVKGPGDAAKGIAILEEELKAIGPIKEIAHTDVHRALGFLNGDLGKADEWAYHRTFGVALLFSMNRSGDGKTPQTAMVATLVREQYVWFEANRNRIQRVSRVSQEIDGRSYDVWTAKVLPSGEETKIYFDVTAMKESLNRQLIKSITEKPTQ
jgi:hypothetical protein